ncbi:MAG: radical SAM family heme chaperone HemW [Bacteroides sp.]|nr:radical SAM family heme chaperone HemW [Bacteroides sp.]MCM1413485.1 radical SAM family heme chaperone HemW [Bacteroides sp.]MCM1471304.1 radical SAM family heme chaperone HemW [Bacteroides sp.]
MSGIYLHIPFCHSKCAYCDFYSTPSSQNIDLYIDRLEEEYRNRIGELGGEKISTIYLGGGTPSILSRRQLERVFSFMPVDEAEEITMEVNPEDIDEEMARFIADMPVNRVSMGVQTMDNDQLRAIGRRHTADDVVNAVEALRKAGIDNLSLDLIFGLPGQSLKSWIETLDATLSMHPEHLSAYSLMIEPGTKIHAMIRAGKMKEPDQDLMAMMFIHLCNEMARRGYEHYEISNFALPGHRSSHNSSYWDLTPYLGLGAAAHSFDGKVRRYNSSNLKQYISGQSSPIVEDNDEKSRINDYLLIRLRTAEGVSLDKFEKQFGSRQLRELLQRCQNTIDGRRILLEHDRLRIPESMWLVSDPILIEAFA